MINTVSVLMGSGPVPATHRIAGAIDLDGHLCAVLDWLAPLLILARNCCDRRTGPLAVELQSLTAVLAVGR